MDGRGLDSDWWRSRRPVVVGIVTGVALAGISVGTWAGAADDSSAGNCATTTETTTGADGGTTVVAPEAAADGTAENEGTTADSSDGCSDGTDNTGETTSSEPTPASDPGSVAGPEPAGDPAPPAAEQAQPTPSAAPAAVNETEGATTAPRRTSRSVLRRAARAGAGSRAVKRKARKARARTRKPVAEPQFYFPPVSVNWTALTPLAAPAFAAGAVTSFQGPLFLLPIYQAAAAEYHVPWQVLASINEIETNYGANVRRSRAGAIGWMQFLPSTWLRYGLDANGDGIANPGDPVDAIFSAARYLHAAGAEHELGRAIYAYNHANWYVDRVVRRAVVIGTIGEDLLAALTERGRSDARAIRRATGSEGLIDAKAKIDSIGRVMLLGQDALQKQVLGDERVSIYECGRQDIAGGVIDRRVLETLEFLAFNELKPSVTSLRCGHGFYTASGNVSEHSFGNAMDISSVNGIAILGNQGPGTITDQTIQKLLELQGALRPHQIISLMTYQGAVNTLALGDHADHIHVGFAARRAIRDF